MNLQIYSLIMTAEDCEQDIYQNNDSTIILKCSLPKFQLAKNFKFHMSIC